MADERCPNDQELIAFAEHQLPAEECATIQAHLSTCWECAEVVEALRSGPEQDSHSEPGAVPERYVPLELLGRGGMGTVFDAYDSVLHRRVALKVLHPGGGRGDAHERLLTEARALARLSHPNIVRVYDVCETPDGVLLVMEHLEGVRFSAWLAESPRSEHEIRDKIIAAATGLVAAHQAGVVHGDLTPANILVGKGGGVWLIDFGLARDVLGSGGGDTRRAPAGTPRYMAPERLRGDPATPSSDRYALCALLLEALSAQSVQKSAAAADSDAVQAPSSPAPAPKGQLAEVARIGMSPEPEARFASTEALIAALRHRSWYRRPMPLAACMVVLLVAAGGLFWWWQRLQAEVTCISRVGELASLEVPRPASPAMSDEQWVALESGLSSHATAWQKAKQEMCTAPLRDLARQEVRISCLAARRQEYAAFLRGLREPTSSLFQSNLTELGSPPLCVSAENQNADTDALGSSVSEQLAEARGLHAAGRFDRAYGVAEKLRQSIEGGSGLAARYAASLLLGEMAVAMSKYDEAAASYEEAVVLATARWQPDALGEALARLAFVQAVMQMRPAPAGEMLLSQAESLIDQARDSASLEALTLYVRARVARARTQAPAALTYLQRALQVLDAHPEVRTVQKYEVHNELGASLLYAGRYEEALAELERARTETASTLGPAHPFAVSATLNTGLALRRLNRLEEARTQLELAVHLRRQTPGVSAFNLGNALHNLATVQADLGASREALRSYTEAAELIGSQFGADDSRALLSRKGAAWALGALGEQEEACRRYESLLPRMERAVGKDHWWVATIKLGLADALLGRSAAFAPKAAALAEQALDTAVKLGIEHSDVAEAKLVLAQALFAEPSRRAEAKQLAAEALLTLEAQRPPSHPSRRKAEKLLAEMAESPP